MCLTFYSQNCFGLPIKNKSRRFRNILQTILENSYDVIFLQEVFFKNDLQLFLNYLENDYFVIYSRKNSIIRGGLVLLVKKDILKHSEYQTDFVRFKNPGILSLHSYELLLGRGKGFLYFYVKELDLYFVNVHCLNVFYISFLEKTIVKQLKELNCFLKDKRCFVAGDFNLSLRDSFLEKENSINLTPNIRTYRFVNKQVDYIFSSNLNEKEISNCSAKSICIGSDHFGLISKLDLVV